MNTGKATLILDLGNSQNRLIVQYGKRKSEPVVFPNFFAQIPEGYSVPNEYLSSGLDDEPSYFFEKVEGVNYASGMLAAREFATKLIRPTSSVVKYESNTSRLSIHMAFAHAYMELARLCGARIEDFDVEWDVIVCLPAVDFGMRHKMETLIREIEYISFRLPLEIKQEVRLGRISIVPEAMSAFFAVVFDRNQKLRKEYAHLTNATVMVMDIGAGTTDVCIIKNFKMVDNSRDTIRQGGNNVQQLVRKALRADNIIISSQVIEEGVVTGTVLDGSRSVDITDKVVAAKSEVAHAIVAGMTEILETIEFNPRDIGYLLTIGGGSLSGDTPPISEPLVEYMKSLSPHISNLPVPEDVDARLLNVIGASIMASR